MKFTKANVLPSVLYAIPVFSSAMLLMLNSKGDLVVLPPGFDKWPLGEHNHWFHKAQERKDLYVIDSHIEFNSRMSASKIAWYRSKATELIRK